MVGVVAQQQGGPYDTVRRTTLDGKIRGISALIALSNPRSRLARELLLRSGMLTLEKRETLSTWLTAVNAHLAIRREVVQAMPRPQRNRERERARREARRLFAEFYADQAIDRSGVHSSLQSTA